MKSTFLSKNLLFCLLFTLTVSLAACGNSSSSSASVASESASATSEPAAASSEEEPTEEEPAPTPTEAPVEEDSAPEETEETVVPSELLGTLTDTSYENDYFGLHYNVPADWYILSRDEAAAITGIAVSNIDDEKLAEMYESNGYVTDLYAMATTPAVEGTTSYNNVNITIQDIGKLYGMIMDEKQLAEVSIGSVEESLGALGLTDIKTEISEMEFIGKTCVISTLVGKAGENTMYQKQVYLKNGSAVACVTATATGEDKTDEILSAFSGSDAPVATEEAPADNTDMTGLPLGSGTISVDGDLFALDTSFSEISGNWKLTTEDAEKYADYTLNPMTTSGAAMGVYKDAYGQEFSSFHVMISLMNDSDEPIPYLEGKIDYLSIPRISSVDTVAPVIFPGGLTLGSTEEEFTAVYGAPTYEYEDESTDFRSVKYEDGDVELQVTWSKGVIDEITLMS